MNLKPMFEIEDTYYVVYENILRWSKEIIFTYLYKIILNEQSKFRKISSN